MPPGQRTLKIDVLTENGFNVGTASAARITLGSPPRCGTAVSDGRTVEFTAPPASSERTVDCSRAIVDYALTVPEQSNPQDRELAGKIVIALPLQPVVAAPPPPPPPPAPPLPVEAVSPALCNVKNAPFPLVRIEGGRFAKQDAPPGLEDVLALIDRDSFEVAPFCIMVTAVSDSTVRAWLGTMPEDRRRALTGEAPAGAEPAADTSASVRAGDDTFECSAGPLPATRTNRALASAFAEHASPAYATDGARFALPTLEEYAAAAIELTRRSPDAPETQMLTIAIRKCAQEWTATPCAGEGKYYAVGQNRRGLLDRYCFWAGDRRSRLGFRLIVR